jgi:phage replication O-like protein O
MTEEISPQKENGYTSIANEIMDALAKIRISGEAMQVLMFILRKTYGWNKKVDIISLSQFIRGTGLKKPAVCKAINKLTAMNLIGTQKDNDIGTSYCFNKHYNSWKPLPKKITVPKKEIIVDEKDNPQVPKKDTTKTILTKASITKELFENFWEAYPRKVGRAKALKAFIKIDPDEEDTNNLIDVLNKQVSLGMISLKENKRFVPHAATWLNEKRYLDDLEIK